MRKRLIFLAAVVALALLPGSAEAGTVDGGAPAPVAAEGCGGLGDAHDVVLD